jgi:hypothetical protein
MMIKFFHKVKIQTQNIFLNLKEMDNLDPPLSYNWTFKASWKMGKKWLMHLNLDECAPLNIDFMKCVAYV